MNVWTYERLFHQTVDFLLSENGEFAEQRPQNIFTGINFLSADHLNCSNFCGGRCGSGQA